MLRSVALALALSQLPPFPASAGAQHLGTEPQPRLRYPFAVAMRYSTKYFGAPRHLLHSLRLSGRRRGRCDAGRPLLFCEHQLHPGNSAGAGSPHSFRPP